MASTVCPLPTAHSYDDVKSAYDSAKKKMPGLTPAAWRKQAAIDLGIDYNTFLSIWKVGKGKGKVVPASTPTVPAAASQTVSMGIKKADIPTGGVTLTPQSIKHMLGADAKYIQAAVDPTDSARIIVTPKAYKDPISSSLAKAKAFEVTKKVLMKNGFSSKIKGGQLVVDVDQKTSLTRLVDAMGYKFKGNIPIKMAKGVDDDIANGIVSFDEGMVYLQHIAAKYPNGNGLVMDMISKWTKIIGQTPPNIKFAKVSGASPAVVKKVAKAAAKAPTAPTKVDGLIQTAHGPLDNALAKAAYKKMKGDMPGASAAQLRHAAAEYLGVGYNDYLKAWKMKPGTSSPAPKLPSTPTTQPHLSPSPEGKYKSKDITPDQLRDELVKLYGPGADKNFINFMYDAEGSYVVMLPNSLLPTLPAKKAVIDGLEKLGLKIQAGTNYKSVKVLGSKSQSAQIKATGTKTLPDGRVVLDLSYADKWTNSWWPSLSQAAKDAWLVYTGSGYRFINSFWRGESKDAYQWSPAQIKSFSTSISKSMLVTKHEFTVFRGSGYISLNQFKVGGKWQEDGFMSTAISPGSEFDGVNMEIICPPGTRGMYIGKKGSSGDEREFLMDRGTEFRVVAVDKANNSVKLVAIPKKVAST